jgi:hypothetical protein
MHRVAFRTCECLAVVWLLSLVACGGDESVERPSMSGSGDAGSGGSATSTGSGGAGASEEGGAGGAGGGDVTGCPALAGRGPVPELGPWMYGSLPGPCAQTETSSDTGAETSFVYEYDGERVVGAVETQGSDTHTHSFEYEGGRMVRMIRSGPADTRVLGVAYDDDAPAITIGHDDYFIRYDYDGQGRPARATFDHFTDELPTITTAFVYEGCRLLRREQGVSPLDGTPSPSLPAFTYVFEGDLLVERVGEQLRSVYDYSCW